MPQMHSQEKKNEIMLLSNLGRQLPGREESRMGGRDGTPPSTWSNTEKPLVAPAYPGTDEPRCLEACGCPQPCWGWRTCRYGTLPQCLNIDLSVGSLSVSPGMNWWWQNVNGECLSFVNSSHSRKTWGCFFFLINIGVEVYLQISFQNPTWESLPCSQGCVGSVRSD